MCLLPLSPAIRGRWPVGPEGEGDAKASATYASAYGQNPEFYSFYRSLEAYKTTFRSKGDVIVLDPSAEFFQYLKQPGGGPPASRSK